MSHDQDLATRLGETLHRRADALHDTPLDLLDVRGRATSIRRRRRAVAGVAAAAVVAAVVVPLSLLPDGGGDRALDLQPAETITPIERPVPLDPQAAPEGAAARIPYLDAAAKRLVTPAGTYDLPEAYRQIVPDGDGGWVALAQGAPGMTGTTVQMLDSDFRVVDASGAPSDALAVREDGGHAADVEYAGTDGWRLVMTELPRVGDYTFVDVAPQSSEQEVHRAVGYVSEDAVVVEATDPDTGRNSYRVVAADGTTTPFDGFNRVDSASSVSGLVAGQTEFTGDGSCNGVLDPLATDPKMVWRTCDHSLGAFSPDGTYVVGLAPYSDSLGSPSVGILDAATGEPVVDFVSDNDPASAAAVVNVAWEDATTLLATVHQGNEDYLLRLGIDGTVERLDAMVNPGGENIRFWFPTSSIG
jgi:hypothetical protein